MSFITLLTDFGIRDGAVGLMKGVIWRIAPEAKIADLSHTIAPQNLQEAAVVLRFGAPYFPPNTVHIVVVDPGVGTHRRPIAARLGDYYFVGPDNGVFTPLLEMAQAAGGPIEIVHTNKPAYWLPEVSQVFHGRDIFSPVGAHLAAGVRLADLGTPIDDPIVLALPQPQPMENGWRGEVIFIDDFGNIHTNLLRQHLQPLGEVRVRLCGVEIEGMVRTFGERPIDTLIALYGTEHDLIVSVVNGNATQRLQTRVGDVVEVIGR
ncbi:MAG: SAM-dependent chlorinase/fluorinase [Ardenticatenaceae bacterium]|nr:SAM-dependent chlorinase/fluorinase [Ardenticatenaceae bacterium]